jgi:hypothetical protein
VTFSTKIYPGIITALSPIHQGGDEKSGNTQMIKRIAFMVDGKKTMIPVISGNSIRGVLRRLIMADMLERLDYTLENIKVYHILFSGGSLESVESDAGYLNLETRRKIRETLPPLSLLGTSMGNQMPSGKLEVDFALPICSELAGFLPAQHRSPRSIYEMQDHDFTTRRDDLRADREEGERAVQMKVDFEILIPGTRFHHRFALKDATDIERAAFGQMLALWNARSHIGGKSAIGFGDVKLDYAGIPDSAPYLAWLEENREKVISQIKEMETAFG